MYSMEAKARGEITLATIPLSQILSQQTHSSVFPIGP